MARPQRQGADSNWVGTARVFCHLTFSFVGHMSPVKGRTVWCVPWVPRQNDDDKDFEKHLRRWIRLRGHWLGYDAYARACMVDA